MLSKRASLWCAGLVVSFLAGCGTHSVDTAPSTSVTVESTASVSATVPVSGTVYSGPITGGVSVTEPAERVSPSAPTSLPQSDPSGTHAVHLVEHGRFTFAWAMSFVPGTDHLLITEKPGRLLLRNNAANTVTQVAGVPPVVHDGQGGMGDVLVHPGYNGTSQRTVFLSWIEDGGGGKRGAVVGKAQLDLSVPGEPTLVGLDVIWRQAPKTTGAGHYSHRLALSPDGAHLFITSGDRQLLDPAQDPNSDLGKIIRLRLSDNSATRWTLGHRNPLGIDFAPDGTLWSSEMGPKGGDELNVIVQGKNYGWPNVSNGIHYDGRDIPNHRPGDGYEPPKEFWTPSISPGSLLIYDGRAFPNWYGDAFLGGLSGKALVRVDIDGVSAKSAEKMVTGERIRALAQGPDGTIWLLEDGKAGRLRQLVPRP